MPVSHTIEDAICTITIDRPQRRNALNLEALNELDAALDAASGASSIAVVLTGSAGHFCAGADLSELEDLAFTVRLREVLDRLIDYPGVTIAAISGACMGLGMQLASACDVRVVDHDAKFAIPVAKLGLMVDRATLQRVGELFGSSAARQMIFAAEVLGVEDAHRYGFAQYLGDLSVAHELATRITTLAPLSIIGSKHGLNRLHLAEDLDYQVAFETAWASSDLAEGQRAFAERRPPKFTGH